MSGGRRPLLLLIVSFVLSASEGVEACPFEL